MPLQHYLPAVVMLSCQRNHFISVLHVRGWIPHHWSLIGDGELKSFRMVEHESGFAHELLSLLVLKYRQIHISGAFVCERKALSLPAAADDTLSLLAYSQLIVPRAACDHTPELSQRGVEVSKQPGSLMLNTADESKTILKLMATLLASE